MAVLDEGPLHRAKRRFAVLRENVRNASALRVLDLMVAVEQGEASLCATARPTVLLPVPMNPTR